MSAEHGEQDGLQIGSPGLIGCDRGMRIIQSVPHRNGPHFMNILL